MKLRGGKQTIKNRIKNILLAILFIAMTFSTGMANFSVFAIDDGEVAETDEVDIYKAAREADDCRTFEMELGVKRERLELQKPIDVVLVLDTSTSMNSHGRLAATKKAAKTFSEIILDNGNPNDNRIAIVRYGTRASLYHDWEDELSTIKSKIDDILISGTNYTNIHEGFIVAENKLDAARPEAEKVIVMMSDGGANRYIKPGGNLGNTNPINYPTVHNEATEAAYLKGQALQTKYNNKIFTIGLFAGMPHDELTIAKETLELSAPPNQFYNAPSTDDLEAIYAKVADNIINPPLTNAKVTDVIGDDFDLVEGTLTPEATYDSNTKTITMDVDYLEAGHTARINYKVRLKGTHPGGNNLDTNEEAKLEFKDLDGVDQTMFFEKPKVEVALAEDLTLTINKEIFDQAENVVESSDADDNKLFSINVVGVNDLDEEIYNEDFMLSRNNPVEITSGLEPGRYTVTEADEDGYYAGTMDYIDLEYGCGANDFVLRLDNFELPSTSFTAKKRWIDGPETHPTVQLQLYQDDKAYGEPVELVDGTLEYTWNKLPQYSHDEHIYEYTVKEVEVPENYTMTQDGRHITNKYQIPKRDYTAKKVWKGGPESKPTIMLQLYQDHKEYGEPVKLVDGVTEYTWTDLDKTDINGKSHFYSVEEVGLVDNYQSMREGHTIFNKYVSPKTEVVAYKVWKGGPNTHLTITFQLYQDGEIFGPAVKLKDGTLQHTWTDLDLTDEDGKNYVYTVKEVAVPEGYDMSISDDGLTVTNTHQQVKSAVVSKVPTTGIENNQMLFTVLLTVSAVGLFMLVYRKKKQKSSK